MYSQAALTRVENIVLLGFGRSAFDEAGFAGGNQKKPVGTFVQK